MSPRSSLLLAVVAVCLLFEGNEAATTYLRTRSEVEEFLKDVNEVKDAKDAKDVNGRKEGVVTNPDNMFYKHAQRNKELRAQGQRTIPLVLAHRGFFAREPENTMKAVKSAVEAGLEGIEVDIRKTKDGVLVLWHDDDVVRLTGKPGGIQDYTFEAVKEWKLLKTFDPGSGSMLTYPNEERVATFEEFLNYIKERRDAGHPLVVDLDCKAVSMKGEEDTGIAIAKAVAAAGLQNHVVATSFYMRTIKGIGIGDKKILVGFGYDDGFPVVGELWSKHNHFETGEPRFRTTPPSSDAQSSGSSWGKAWSAIKKTGSAILRPVAQAATAIQKTVASKSRAMWQGVKDVYTDVVTGQMFGRLIFKTVEEVAQYYLKATDAVIIEHTVLTAELVARFHSKGYVVGSYTVLVLDKRYTKKKMTKQDEVNIAISLAKAGVDWIETDDPEVTQVMYQQYLKDGQIPRWEDLSVKRPHSLLYNAASFAEPAVSNAK